MEKHFFQMRIAVLHAIFLVGLVAGCEGKNEEADSDVGGAGGSADGGGMDGGQDSGAPQAGLGGSSGTGSAGCCACPDGIDKYTDAGVNRYIYDNIGTSGLPIFKFLVFCFTRGVDCEKYEIELRTDLEMVGVGPGSLEFGYTNFFLQNGEHFVIDAAVEDSPNRWALEIKGASLEYREVPCEDRTIPHIVMQGSLETVAFIEDERNELPDYVRLRDSQGNIVFEAWGYCDVYGQCEEIGDDAGVEEMIRDR